MTVYYCTRAIENYNTIQYNRVEDDPNPDSISQSVKPPSVVRPRVRFFLKFRENILASPVTRPLKGGVPVQHHIILALYITAIKAPLQSVGNASTSIYFSTEIKRLLAASPQTSRPNNAFITSHDSSTYCPVRFTRSPIQHISIIYNSYNYRSNNERTRSKEGSPRKGKCFQIRIYELNRDFPGTRSF